MRARIGIAAVLGGILAAMLLLQGVHLQQPDGGSVIEDGQREPSSHQEENAGMELVTNAPGSLPTPRTPQTASFSSAEDFPIEHELTLEDDLTLTLRMKVGDPQEMVPKSYERFLAGLDPEIVGHFVAIELLGRNGEDLTASRASNVHYNHYPSMIPMRGVSWGIGEPNPLETELPVSIESLNLAPQYEFSLVDFISVIRRKLAMPEYRHALLEGSRFRLHFTLTSPYKGEVPEGTAKITITEFQSNWIELSPMNLEYLNAYLDSD